MPNTPVKAPGMRIDPPPSLAVISAPMPVASATAEPPLDPPGVMAGFQGLRVMPVSGLSVMPFQPSSGVVVLPRNTAPASRSRATAGASPSHFWLFGSIALLPRKVGQPLVSMMSLTPTGTPSSGPLGSPRCQRFSDARAAANAALPSIRQ